MTPKMLAVAGNKGSGGKSTLTVNLARALALIGATVLSDGDAIIRTAQDRLSRSELPDRPLEQDSPSPAY